MVGYCWFVLLCPDGGLLLVRVTLSCMMVGYCWFVLLDLPCMMVLAYYNIMLQFYTVPFSRKFIHTRDSPASRSRVFTCILIQHTQAWLFSARTARINIASARV